jgi:hypothetical protein
MSSEEIEEIGRCPAVSENGTVYTVVEYRPVRELSGEKTTSRGVRFFRLLDGRDVNRIDDSTFEILERHEVIRKL